MLLLIAAILGVLGGLWHGGALRYFARLPFRWPLVFLAGLALRLLAFSPLVPAGRLALALYVLALACLCAGLAVNRGIAGIEFILIGLVLNAAVILANGGAMPVSPDALQAVGHYDFVLQLRDAGTIGHVKLLRPDTHLRALADLIPLSPMPGLRSVISVGDLFIAAGTLLIFYVGTLRAPREPVPLPDAAPAIAPDGAAATAPEGEVPAAPPAPRKRR
ncbi:MAG TPA: DUF5317 family protein [Thermomicrobiales bacterium]|nr:DUF5317 family protein [Thermomicrobiales bacterium]